MLNPLDAYASAGRIIATARNVGEDKFATEHERHWRAMMDEEDDAQRPFARAAFNDAYALARTT